MFSCMPYELKELRDLERYWFDLQSVCLKTDMIVGECTKV